MECKEVCQVGVIPIIMQRAPNVPYNQGALQKYAHISSSQPSPGESSVYLQIVNICTHMGSCCVH